MTLVPSCRESDLEAFSTTTAVPRRWFAGDGSPSVRSTGVAWKQLQAHASIFTLD